MKKKSSYLLVPYIIGICLSFVMMLSACSKPEPGLKDIFSDYFKIGVALNPIQVFGYDTLAQPFIIKHFNTITAEDAMKWERIHPLPGTFNFTIADSTVAFGKRNGMFIDGHVLVWHSQTPDWVFTDSLGNPMTRDALLARMKDHIFTVAGRYKGQITGWDVVNEAIDDNGEMRKNKWYEIIGEDYVQKAFEYAHEADPDAELYYNDYNIEEPVKREGVVRLIKKLQEQGVKIDGVGIQGHWLMDTPELTDIDSSIRIYAGLGMKVLITEMDIDVLPFDWSRPTADVSLHGEWRESLNPYKTGLPDSMQTAQANRYADIFRIFVKYKDDVARVTFWGLHDGYSWRNNWPVPGRTNYPLLFDRNYQPKPAYYAVIKTVRGE
jgi:endo-1,4-beta-xylanase